MNYNYKNKLDFTKNNYFHDYAYLGLNYDYINRVVTIYLQNNSIYEIIFKEILFFDMQSCEFWNPGKYVYHIWIEKNCEKINEYMSMLKNDVTLNTHNLSSYNELLYVIMKLNSGDELRIICKEILV